MTLPRIQRFKKYNFKKIQSEPPFEMNE